MFISRDPIGLMGGSNTFAYAPNPTGWIDPLGLARSMRQRMYPTRVRTPVRNKLEKDSNGICAGCNEKMDVTNKKLATVQHDPPLYQTHNEKGYNTDQATRNDLYNSTADSLVCLPCQLKEGGEKGKTERYTLETGENYEARKPRKPKTDAKCTKP